MNNYHISWLELALKNCKNNNSSTIQGDMTIQEYIETWCKEELNNVFELEED